MSKVPRANIEWTDVEDDDDVRLVGKEGSRSYVVNEMAVATWCGQSAQVAQLRLEQLVRKTRGRERIQEATTDDVQVSARERDGR